MNVFEDLVGELKGDDLLEATVLDLACKVSTTAAQRAKTPSQQSKSAPSGALHRESGSADVASNLSVGAGAVENPAEFYRKRAMDEVSNLQMVEHIISAIERKHLRSLPAAFDDLGAKKALHRFLQVASDVEGPEYAEAEYGLLNETEAWATALAERDVKLSAANLRRFCENSRPPLSSQALMSLARFYRNASFTSLARSKFDVVMTRLFSRDEGDDKRRLLFPRNEIVSHIRTLYANWASVDCEPREELKSQIEAIIGDIQVTAVDAAEADSFDDLVRADTFGKLNEIKESMGDLFYLPEVLAAIIDCNVRVGNRFVDLLYCERARTTPEKIEERYGYTYDQIVSEAAGKTLHLLDLLKNAPDLSAQTFPMADSKTFPMSAEPHRAKDVPVRKSAAQGETPRSGMSLRVNKWLLVPSFLAIVLSVGIYFWSDSYSPDEAAIPAAKQVDVSNTEFGQFLGSGRKTNTTLYVIAQPPWDTASSEQRKEVLRKAATFASRLNLRNVQVMDPSGKSVAFVSGDRVEVAVNP